MNDFSENRLNNTNVKISLTLESGSILIRYLVPVAMFTWLARYRHYTWLWTRHFIWFFTFLLILLFSSAKYSDHIQQLWLWIWIWTWICCGYGTIFVRYTLDIWWLCHHILWIWSGYGDIAVPYPEHIWQIWFHTCSISISISIGYGNSLDFSVANFTRNVKISELLAIAGYAHSHSRDPLEDLSLSCCDEEAQKPQRAWRVTTIMVA